MITSTEETLPPDVLADLLEDRGHSNPADSLRKVLKGDLALCYYPNHPYHNTLRNSHTLDLVPSNSNDSIRLAPIRYVSHRDRWRFTAIVDPADKPSFDRALWRVLTACGYSQHRTGRTSRMCDDIKYLARRLSRQDGSQNTVDHIAVVGLNQDHLQYLLKLLYDDPPERLPAYHRQRLTCYRIPLRLVTQAEFESYSNDRYLDQFDPDRVFIDHAVATPDTHC